MELTNEEEKIEYDEKKAIHFKVRDIDVYVIPVKERKLTEAGGGLPLQIKGKRETEYEWGAMIVNDPKWGTTPYDAWQEYWRGEVATNVTKATGSNVPKGTVSVYSRTPQAFKHCRNCDGFVPSDSEYCPICSQKTY